MSSRSTAVQRAYEQGKLFAHMFEFNTHDPYCFAPETDPSAYKCYTKPCFATVFGVMAGDVSQRYESQYFGVGGEDGAFTGLPCTALKKGIPTHLFTLCDRMGLLLDGTDTKNAAPLMVGSSDLFSASRDGMLKYHPYELFNDLVAVQNIKRLDQHMMQGYFSYSEIPNMIERAQKALPIMWKQIERMGWDAYSSRRGASDGMNEVSVQARIGGVRGLIINEISKNETAIVSNEEDYASTVHKAVELRDWLTEKYPQAFPQKLPIFSYNPNRKQDVLMELTEEKLAHPELPLAGNVAASTHAPVGAGPHHNQR